MRVFAELPHSNHESLKLLLAAIASIDASIAAGLDAWSHPSQFRKEVRDWFIG